MTQKSILLVEDELVLAELLADYLRAENYRVHLIANGDEVIPWFSANKPDLLLLDLMLPGKDGLSLCREIRAFSEIPILLATAKVDEIDRLLGLELGADDYICKPYSPREVVARVKANLRRARFLADASLEKNLPGDVLKLDEGRQTISFSDKSMELTAVEFQLLSVLCSHPGRIFNRGQLMDSMYDDHRIVSDRTVDSHIRKIRNKLDSICPDKELIQSVYGVGYRFEPEPSA